LVSADSDDNDGEMTLLYRLLPEGTGWILDGYPVTLSQAVLLEKAVSGYDGTVVARSLQSDSEAKASSTASHQSIDASGHQQKPMKKSQLVSEPRPAPPSPPPVSGMDAAILLDVSDELSLLRAADTSRTSVSLSLSLSLCLSVCLSSFTCFVLAQLRFSSTMCAFLFVL